MRPDHPACEPGVVSVHHTDVPHPTHILAEEQAFSVWADFLPQPVCLATPDGNVYWYNRYWQDLTGKMTHEMEGLGWPAFHAGGASSPQLEAWRHAIAQGEAFERVIHMRTVDSSAHPFLLKVSPVRDGNGPILRWMGIAIDMSQQMDAEQMLANVRQEYEALFTHVKEGILITDDEGRYLNANPAICEALGLPVEQIVGRRIPELFLRGREDVFTTLWQRFLRDGEMVGEIPFTRPDGQTIYFEFCAVANYAPNRNLSVLRDITERKTVQDALLESEHRFRAMADSAPMFIWLSDTVGNTHFLNKSWLDFLGMSEREAIDGGLKAAMPPDEQAEAAATYRAAFAKRESYMLENRFRRFDGEMRWLWTQGAPLLLPNGELTGYIGLSVDITERKQSETLLHQGLERERLLRRMVEIKSQSFDIDVILKTVAQETGRYFNADRCSVSRFSVKDGKVEFNLSAQYWAEHCTPVDPEDIRLITDAAQHLSPQMMAENQEQIVNISNPDQYIEHLRARMAALPELPGLSTDKLVEIVLKYDVKSSLRVNIYYRGTHYGSISLSQCTHNRIWTADEIEMLKVVSEHAGSAIYQAELYQTAQETAVREHEARKELEGYARRLEISNRELEQFAAIASHDLQEPLRKVRMFSQMIAEQCTDDGKEYVERMQASVSRMQDLITDVLALSRINRTGQPFQTVDLNQCIQNVLDDLALTIQEEKPHLVIEPLLCVEGDGRQLEQLFLNLIGNALKFHLPGEAPNIHISGAMSGKGQYCISVSDQGIGFNPIYQERIFEPFERLHGRTGKYMGTGMGLAIARKIVERHNGTIQVVSQEGDGTCFMVTLPVAHKED